MTSPAASITLNIKTLTRESYAISLDAKSPVPALKELIATKTGVIIGRQRLIFRGKVLKNHQTIDEYALESGHTLHLVVRPENVPASNEESSNDASSSSSSNNNNNNNNASSNLPSGNMNHHMNGARVIMGATITVPEGADMNMPVLGSIISNIINSVQGTMGGNDPTTNTTTGTPSIASISVHQQSNSSREQQQQGVADMMTAQASAARNTTTRNRSSRRTTGPISHPVDNPERHIRRNHEIIDRIQRLLASPVPESVTPAFTSTPRDSSTSTNDNVTLRQQMQHQIQTLRSIVPRLGPHFGQLDSDLTSGRTSAASDSDLFRQLSSTVPIRLMECLAELCFGITRSISWHQVDSNRLFLPQLPPRQRTQSSSSTTSSSSRRPPPQELSSSSSSEAGPVSTGAAGVESFFQSIFGSTSFLSSTRARSASPSRSLLIPASTPNPSSNNASSNGASSSSSSSASPRREYRLQELGKEILKSISLSAMLELQQGQTPGVVQSLLSQLGEIVVMGVHTPPVTRQHAPQWSKKFAQSLKRELLGRPFSPEFLTMLNQSQEQVVRVICDDLGRSLTDVLEMCMRAQTAPVASPVFHHSAELLLAKWINSFFKTLNSCVKETKDVRRCVEHLLVHMGMTQTLAVFLTSTCLGWSKISRKWTHRRSPVVRPSPVDSQHNTRSRSHSSSTTTTRSSSSSEDHMMMMMSESQSVVDESSDTRQGKRRRRS